MKVSDIKTENKERDFEICTLWLEGELPTEEIAGRYSLSTRQINRIVYNNREVLNWDLKHEKNKRVRWLKRQVESNPKSKKDPADLTEQLRKELEGDKPLVDNSRKLIIQSISYENADNTDTKREVSRGDTPEPERYTR